MVLLGLSDERHVGIIQIDGIDQWQGLIVEYVDVTREAAARLPDPGAQGLLEDGDRSQCRRCLQHRQDLGLEKITERVGSTPRAW